MRHSGGNTTFSTGRSYRQARIVYTFDKTICSYYLLRRGDNPKNENFNIFDKSLCSYLTSDSVEYRDIFMKNYKWRHDYEIWTFR